MALSQSQKKFIQNAFNDLVYLPTTPEEAGEILRLAKQLAALLSDRNSLVLTDELKKNLYDSKKHELERLVCCLMDPTHYYQSLETMHTNKIMVSEVQQYILKFFSEVFVIAAKKLDKNLNSFGWDQQKFLNLIPTENATTLFHSAKAPVESSQSPVDLPQLEGKIYQQMLYFKKIEEQHPVENSNEIITIFIKCRIYVRVKVLDDKQWESLYLTDAPQLDSDAAERKFYDDLLKKAETEAFNHAAYRAKEYLKRKFPYYRDYKETLSPAAKMLLLDQYYFDLFKNDKMIISKILPAGKNNLWLDMAENLTDPQMILLIKNRILDIDQAKTLTPHERKMVTSNFYLNQLLDKKIQPSAILGTYLDQHRCFFLTHPIIVNLIKKKVFTISEAKEVSLNLQEVLIKEIYSAYFLKEKIDWQKLRDVDKNCRDILLDKDFSRLIINGGMHFLEIKKISRQKFQFLKENYFIFPWLEQKLISIDDIDSKISSMQHIHFNVYAQRLLNLYQKTLFLKNDSLSCWIGELSFAAQNCKLSPTAFLEIVLNNFLLTVKSQLENEFDSSIDNNPILDLICQQELAKEPNWTEAFLQIMDLAKQNVIAVNFHRLSTNTSQTEITTNTHIFFTPERKKPKNTAYSLKKIYENFLDLEEIGNYLMPKNNFGRGFKSA